MTRIFISYTRTDRPRAEFIARKLISEGFSVWWDRNITAGRPFDEVIELEINNAECVIVLWSAISVNSHWVRSEASEGLRRDILIPVCIESIAPPLEFRRLQTLTTNGTDDLERLCSTELLEAIDQKLGSSSSFSITARPPTDNLRSPSDPVKAFKVIFKENKRLAQYMYKQPYEEIWHDGRTRYEHLKGMTFDIQSHVVEGSRASITINWYYRFSILKKYHHSGTLHYTYKEGRWIKSSYQDKYSFKGHKTIKKLEKYYRKYPGLSGKMILEMQ